LPQNRFGISTNQFARQIKIDLEKSETHFWMVGSSEKWVSPKPKSTFLAVVRKPKLILEYSKQRNRANFCLKIDLGFQQISLPVKSKLIWKNQKRIFGWQGTAKNGFHQNRNQHF
jgi:hypothetical protein